MGFTVVYNLLGTPGTGNITITGVRSIDIAPNNARQTTDPAYRPQSIRLNGGIGGGGIAGAGAFLVPIAAVVSITVTAA